MPPAAAAAPSEAAEGGTSERYLHDLEVLNTIHRISDSSGLSLNERLSAIVKVVAFHLKNDACSIYLDNAKGDGRFVLTATHGLNPGAVGRVALNPGEGVTGWVGRERIALPIEDINQDSRFKIISEVGEEGFQAILAAPIRLEQRLIGVINVQSREVREYPPHQVRLLETIGMHLGGIIRATQLYEDTRKQLKHLRIINGIGQALVSTLHLDPLLEMVLEKSRELTHTRGGVLRLWDDACQQLVVRVTAGESLPEEELRPLYLGESVPGMSALKQETYCINGEDPEAPEALLPRGVMRNYLCVPVVYEDRAIGTISVYDREGDDHDRLSEDDLSLLKTLSNQVAVAIRNAQVCDELTDTVDDLTHTRDLLVQSETLAAVGRMARGVVQEVRVPLVPLEGLAHRLLNNNELDEITRRTYLEAILREAGRLSAFVAEMNALSEASRVRLEPVDIDGLVQAILDSRADQLEGCGVVLEMSLNAGCEPSLDAKQLGEALSHILNNALDAMPTGGVLTVHTESCSYPVDGEQVEGVRLSVRDSGRGIDEEALGQLFLPFFTTKEHGRGLSLATAYRIVRAHGGTLLAHNPPEGGADFTVFLPLLPPRGDMLPLPNLR
ncbi:MAG: GAF domain-containing protein [Leptospirillia bacterium]